MLKISIIDSLDEQKLVVQGRLIEPWVSELRTIWQNTRGDLRDRKCVVDLQDTTVIDPSGMCVLEMMHKAGARLITKGVLNKYFLKSMIKKCADASKERS